MNWKNRLTNYNFWISIFSAVLLILQAFKIEFVVAYVNEIFTAVLGLLVVIGIISDPTRTSVKLNETTSTTSSKQEETTQETELNTTEKTLPTIEENEVDNVANETDIQTVLNKISSDINDQLAIFDEKIKELKKFNTEITNCSNKNNQKEEISSPAVAETDNLYVDVIN